MRGKQHRIMGIYKNDYSTETTNVLVCLSATRGFNTAPVFPHVLVELTEMHQSSIHQCDHLYGGHGA